MKTVEEELKGRKRRRRRKRGRTRSKRERAPCAHFMEGVLIGDVIHNDSSLTVSVVNWSQGMVPLLTCSVLEQGQRRKCTLYMYNVCEHVNQKKADAHVLCMYSIHTHALKTYTYIHVHVHVHVECSVQCLCIHVHVYPVHGMILNIHVHVHVCA